MQYDETRDPDQMDAAGQDDPSLGFMGQKGTEANAPMTFQPSPAEKARTLLAQRQGASEQPQKISAMGKVANGLQGAGSWLSKGQPVPQGQQLVQQPAAVHPETYAKFSSWLDEFKKSGGQI